MSSSIYENFKKYFPLIEPEVDSYRINGDFDMMIVELKDGGLLIYDDNTNTIRNAPSDDKNMTEEYFSSYNKLNPTKRIISPVGVCYFLAKKIRES